jgi:hypothetical protein
VRPQAFQARARIGAKPRAAKAFREHECRLSTEAQHGSARRTWAALPERLRISFQRLTNRNAHLRLIATTAVGMEVAPENTPENQLKS